MQFRGRGSYWSRALRGAGGLSFRLLTLYGFVAVITTVPLLASVFGSLPVWIPVAVGLTALLGVVGESAYRENRRTEDRLEELEAATTARFDTMRYALVLDNMDSRVWVASEQSVRASVSIGLVFTSATADVLEFKVESMSVELHGGLTAPPSSSQIAQQGARIVHGQQKTYAFPAIPDVAVRALTGGRVEYVVIYGHPTGGQWYRRRHEFEFAWHRKVGSDRLDQTDYRDILDEIEAV
jgi:hypothetical protein